MTKQTHFFHDDTPLTACGENNIYKTPGKVVGRHENFYTFTYPAGLVIRPVRAEAAAVAGET